MSILTSFPCGPVASVSDSKPCWPGFISYKVRKFSSITAIAYYIPQRLQVYMPPSEFGMEYFCKLRRFMWCFTSTESTLRRILKIRFAIAESTICRALLDIEPVSDGRLVYFQHATTEADWPSATAVLISKNEPVFKQMFSSETTNLI